MDVSNEDFQNNKTTTYNGEVITPSSFNIFRDSLRQTSERLHETLLENLPDINNAPGESESEAEPEESDNDEVTPLDFCTALMNSGNGEEIVVQAKPMKFKTVQEDLEDLAKEEEKER